VIRLPRTRTLLVIAAIAALVALALVVWSVLAGGVVPVMVSMSLGQVIGTLSLVLYLAVVVRDAGRARLLEDRGELPGPDSTPDPDPAEAKET
jgi:hypothetical protein